MNVKSIRPFVGSKDFDKSRAFYAALGFTEGVIGHDMSVFTMEGFAFYLQKAYVKDWIDNTMIFLEVDDVSAFWNKLVTLDLPSRFKNVKILPIRTEPWGSECFVIDPSGVLWHVGEFAKQG